jgi:FlaA1/EpsC-like NDP-sugar epimerase
MNVLVTGGTGSLGSVLVPEFLRLGYNVSILNKDSHKQALARKLYKNHNIRWYLGDICDRDLLMDATRGQDIVVAAAAIKRIEMCAEFSREAMRVNADGTYNTARACVANRVRKCLLISSDKAAESSTFYGSTKHIAEGIWLNHDNGDNQQFAAIRWGNCLNSQGSVWGLWSKAKLENKPLIVRDPEPTRFVLNLKYAKKLALDALGIMYKHSKCIFVPGDLPAFSLWDLAKAIEPDEYLWTWQSLLTGEKQHEVLLAKNEYAKQASDLLWATCDPYDMGNREMFASNTTCNRLTAQGVIQLMEET